MTGSVDYWARGGGLGGGEGIINKQCNKKEEPGIMFKNPLSISGALRAGAEKPRTSGYCLNVKK